MLLFVEGYNFNGKCLHPVLIELIVAEPVASIMPVLQRLEWLVMIYHMISDLPSLANFSWKSAPTTV